MYTLFFGILRAKCCFGGYFQKGFNILDPFFLHWRGLEVNNIPKRILSREMEHTFISLCRVLEDNVTVIWWLDEMVGVLYNEQIVLEWKKCIGLSEIEPVVGYFSLVFSLHDLGLVYIYNGCLWFHGKLHICYKFLVLSSIKSQVFYNWL